MTVADCGGEQTRPHATFMNVWTPTVFFALLDGNGWPV